MTTRRPRGTGTIERTPTGHFRARFSFDGKKREAIEGSPFATYEEAEAALDGVLALLAASPVAGMTLLRLGEKALALRDRQGYRSVGDDRYMWDRHIATWELASTPAKLIKRGDVRERLAVLRNKRTSKPLGTQTKRNVLNMLRAVFAYGCDAEIVDENPCRDLKVKSMGSTIETSTFLTLDEANALTEAATDPAVAIAIWTGVRSGELRSLCWGDVHVEGDAPHIVIRFGKPNEPPKNGRIRHVPLFGVALAALTKMRPVHYADAEGDVLIEKDALPVLPSLSGWHRQKARVVEPEDWKTWKIAAGITRPLRWHDLRHTCATLLLSGAWGRSWTYEEVKEMLGHSSVKVTERYAHAVGTLVSKAAKAMRAGAVDKPSVSPANDAAIMTQARGILQRCGWDLNPHMPVLQTAHAPRDSRSEPDDLGNAWAAAIGYAAAVLQRDPHAHARGLDLAEAVFALVAAREQTSVAT